MGRTVTPGAAESEGDFAFAGELDLGRRERRAKDGSDEHRPAIRFEAWDGGVRVECVATLSGQEDMRRAVREWPRIASASQQFSIGDALAQACGELWALLEK